MYSDMSICTSASSSPNMKLASEPIENLSAREKFLFQPVLRLRNDSPAEVIRQVIRGVKDVLAADGRVLEQGVRVRFTGISALSCDVSVFAYVDAADWAGYLEVAEALNFEILAVLEKAGARLAVQVDEVFRSPG